jgi:hypothetical protein
LFLLSGTVQELNGARGNAGERISPEVDYFYLAKAVRMHQRS